MIAFVMLKKIVYSNSNVDLWLWNMMSFGNLLRKFRRRFLPASSGWTENIGTEGSFEMSVANFKPKQLQNSKYFSINNVVGKRKNSNHT